MTTSSSSSKPLKLFYCYAHEDKDLRDDLDAHLSILQHQGLLEVWYDREIGAGTKWEREIDTHLNDAQIILLLVSARFMSSKYCYGIEMQKALQRDSAGTARVIPIIMRPVYWENAPFSNLQVLPTDAKPVTKWSDPNDAFEDITRQISRVIRELRVSLKTKEEWLAEGDAHKNQRRYEEALGAYEQVIRVDPTNALAYKKKGDTLDDLKKHEEAIVALNQSIRLNPNDAHTYYIKGIVFYNLKRNEEALAAYEQAIRLNPKYASAYYNKGNALRILKRNEEALAAYEQAIHLNPTFANAYCNKGNVLDDLKRYEEALAAYEQAIRLNPNDADFYHNKGIALQRMNRGKEAQEAFEKARQLGYSG